MDLLTECPFGFQSRLPWLWPEEVSFFRERTQVPVSPDSGTWERPALCVLRLARPPLCQGRRWKDREEQEARVQEQETGIWSKRARRLGAEAAPWGLCPQGRAEVVRLVGL